MKRASHSHKLLYLQKYVILFRPIQAKAGLNRLHDFAKKHPGEWFQKGFSKKNQQKIGQPASAGDPTYHVNVFIHAAAHNPERATLKLGLCHGVFTDLFIFRHILGQFFTRKWNIHHAMNAFEV